MNQSNEHKREDIKRWIRALRSGDYKQGAGRLQSTKGFCCLGVACDLFAQNAPRYPNGALMGVFPFHGPNFPFWVSDIDAEFYHLTNNYLSSLNDIDLLTFDEIADCLQAVYIHKVLS
jgi:hypothetical protein